MSFYFGNSVPKSIKDCLLRLAPNIELEKESTKGCNGYLFFGRNRVSNLKVAIKFYYWGGDKNLHVEPQALSEIRSPNVIEVHDAGYADNSYAYFVTTYHENGDADEYLKKKVSTFKAIDLTSQILNGLTHLHQQRLLHRDLKPENIYIKNDFSAVIGDFGSIKKIPEGNSTVPASKHSILYRPPESIETNQYSYEGDVYQAGIFLYQALGGYLPYEEMAWLSIAERKHYDSLNTPYDQKNFVDQCLRTKITKGKILNFSSLPAWTPKGLQRIVRNACKIQPDDRYRTASEFRVKLHDIRGKVINWEIYDGLPTCQIKDRAFRIIQNDQGIIVEKKLTGNWRRTTEILGNTTEEACRSIEARYGL